MVDSKGRRLLRMLTTPSPLSASHIAREIGVSRAAVSAWLCGRTVPSAPYRALLAERYGIPIDSWPTGRRGE